MGQFNHIGTNGKCTDIDRQCPGPRSEGTYFPPIDIKETPADHCLCHTDVEALVHWNRKQCIAGIRVSCDLRGDAIHLCFYARADRRTVPEGVKGTGHTFQVMVQP